jgi:hypothetical protein
MSEQRANYAKHQLKFWHWGESEDFFDVPQWEHWVATVQALERGDAAALIDFLLHQNDKPILPSLRRIIRRMTKGWPFSRADGYLLRLERPAFDRSRGRAPEDVDRPDRIRHAGMAAYDAIQQGVGMDAATKQAAKAHGVRVDEARASRDEWIERMRQE